MPQCLRVQQLEAGVWGALCRRSAALKLEPGAVADELLQPAAVIPTRMVMHAAAGTVFAQSA